MPSLLVNGTDRSTLVLWRSVSWDPALTARVDTMKFSIMKFGSRTYAPTLFDEIAFYHGSTILFAGSIVGIEESIDGQERQIYKIVCKDRTQQLDRYLVQERYENTPVINIIIDILNRYGNKGSRLEVATFEDNEVWSGGAIDTTYFRTGTQGRKLTSTNAVGASMTRDIIVDLNPTGYAETDYIEVDVYVDDYTKLDTLTITLGNSALTSYYAEEVSGQVTANGWNHIRVLRSDFGTTGSPAWASIAKIKIEVVSTASNTVECTFDNWNEVKSTAFTWTGATQATQEVKYIAFNYEPISKALKRLAELFAWDWYVSPERNIVFVQRFQELAPFNLDDTSGNYVYNSLVVKNSADQIRNAIYVRGSDYLAGSEVADLTHLSDGVNTIYNLGFSYKNYSLTVNAVPYSVGIQNVQSFTDNEGAGQKSTGGTAITLGSASTNEKIAQQVYCTAGGTRATIAVRIRKVGSPSGNFQVQLFSDNGSGAPSATALSTVATLSGATVTASYVEYEFTLTPTTAGDLALVAGTKYHIVLSRSSAVDGSHYYELDGYSYGSYDGATQKWNGSAWSNASSSLYFIEYFNFEALYSFTEKTLVFASAPNPAHTIAWTGQPYLPTVVRVANNDSVDEFGTYEMLIKDLSIKSKEGARQRALAELTAYAQGLSDVTFKTYTSGLNTGQTITIASTVRGISLSLMITGIKGRCRTPDTMEYEVNCVSSKKMGIIYWMQEQLLRDNQDIVIDDNEVLDRTESIAETVTSSVIWTTELFEGKVWSNDAGTTPNALQWDGGATHIWI